MVRLRFLPAVLLCCALCAGSRLRAQLSESWARELELDAGGSDLAAVATNTHGHIVVSAVAGPIGEQGIVTLKLREDGEVVWESPISTGEGTSGFSRTMAVDDAGNVYVVGGFSGESGLRFRVFKHDPDGQPLWASDPDDRFQYGPFLAVDADGAVYAAGESYSTELGYDYAVIKYSRDGEELWAWTYDGPGQHDDRLAGIALDREGNVIVTGSSRGEQTPNGKSLDYATLKLSPEGSVLWERRYQGTADHEDTASGVAVDDDGNIFVTGRSTGFNPSSVPFPYTQDFVTIKYHPDGSQAWVARAIGAWDRAEFAESPAGIVADHEGNVVVTGTRSFPLSRGLETIKYGSEGEKLWTSRYAPPASESVTPEGLVLSDRGDVIIAGTIAKPLVGGPGPSEDFLTVRYNSDGDLLCEARFNGESGGDDVVRDVASGPSGELYVAGVVFEGRDEGNPDRIAVVRYDPTPSPSCSSCSAEALETCPELSLAVADPFEGKLRLGVFPQLEADARLTYTFQVEHFSLDEPLVIGPQSESFVDLDLQSELSGRWRFTVRIDRAPYCPHNTGESVCVTSAEIPHIDFGPFLRGDANDDLAVDISDAVTLLFYLFLDPHELRCKAAGDVNGDGAVDVSDPIYLLQHRFLGSPPPPEPRSCGFSSSLRDERLGCQVRCR